jgi:nitric oxide reductase large subunit
MEFYGQPEKAKEMARERALQDPTIVGFWETILISIGIKAFLWLIDYLIDHWDSNRIASPPVEYQTNEPGYMEYIRVQ